MANEFKLIVDGEQIATNEFVKSIFQDIVTAILRNLRGLEEINNLSSIEIRTE